MNNYYVYAHRKADTGEVFYVGKEKVSERTQQEIEITTGITSIINTD